jgi:hypothetical protein
MVLDVPFWENVADTAPDAQISYLFEAARSADVDAVHEMVDCVGEMLDDERDVTGWGLPFAVVSVCSSSPVLPLFVTTLTPNVYEVDELRFVQVYVLKAAFVLGLPHVVPPSLVNSYLLKL